jgi:hypothetical protein
MLPYPIYSRIYDFQAKRRRRVWETRSVREGYYETIRAISRDAKQRANDILEKGEPLGYYDVKEIGYPGDEEGERLLLRVVLGKPETIIAPKGLYHSRFYGQKPPKRPRVSDQCWVAAFRRLLALQGPSSKRAIYELARANTRRFRLSTTSPVSHALTENGYEWMFGLIGSYRSLGVAFPRLKID